MGRSSTSRRASMVAWSLVSALVALIFVLGACGPDPSQSQAQQNRAQLDNELGVARQMGIPDDMLSPVVSREQSLSAGQGGWGYDYHAAASQYAQLYSQLQDIERNAGDVLKQRASQQVDAFSALVIQRKAQGFSEASAYQTRVAQAQRDLASARTPADFARINTFAQGQVQSLVALWPVYQQLQDFQGAYKTLQHAGLTVDWAVAAYQQDLALVRAAVSPQRYTRLGQVVQGQIALLAADRAQAFPYVGGALLSQFQGQIDLLASFGEPTAQFQREHDAVTQQLATAHSPADYLTLIGAINHARAQLSLPLARGQARHDITTLQALVKQVQAKNPLLVYEYANGSRGEGDVEGWFTQAPLRIYWNATCEWDVVCRYNIVDQQAVQMATNLRAMVDNLSDPTPANQPHQTDFVLMRQYGIEDGQVTIVSLREQTLRAYDHGTLVFWTYITTGRYERPSPPGVQYTMWKATHIEFLPTEPIGSPIRGNKTPINYAVNYDSPFWYQFRGFFLHDAWWRLKFGPGSNLPHWDPATFNGGSHGCINLPLDKMVTYFAWVQVGTPVILY